MARTKKRLLARKIRFFCRLLAVLVPGTLCSTRRNGDLSELILPVYWSGPVVMAWDDGGAKRPYEL